MFEEAPVHHKGIMQHMALYTTSHEKLCKEKYNADVLLTVLKTDSREELDELNAATMVHYVMTQYSMKAAMRKFPGVAEEAITKELLQVHTKDAFQPLDASKLSSAQKAKALEST